MTPTDLPAFLGSAAQGWGRDQPVLATVLAGVALLVVAFLAFALTRRLLVALLNRLARRANRSWDDALARHRFFHRLARVVPLLIVRAGLPHLPALPPDAATLLQRLVDVWMVIAVTRAVTSLINALGDIYATTPRAAERPIKGYLQVSVLVLYVIAAVISVAILLDRDPFLLLTGIGAASAVLLLIFQNTILGLVAGVQLTSNDLIKVGDWITMPDMEADGFVTEIALNTVTVQNWDKTYTVIPAQNFLSHPFMNWRGMMSSGGRRIKRSLSLDVSTIRFLSEEEIDGLRRFALLRDYFDEKEADIEAWTERNPVALEDAVNSRRLTNVGTFRAYVTRYLRAHPGIAQDMTFLVRQLQPGPTGLPIEVYVFVNDVRWAVYEGVQADVFDHLFAILPEFGLRTFQAPSGQDVRALAAARAGEHAVVAGEPAVMAGELGTGSGEPATASGEPTTRPGEPTSGPGEPAS